MAKFYLFFGLAAVLFAGSLTAQDARFAQFYSAPLQTNPALTGVMEGQLRFTANYRELYTSILGNEGFKTIAAGLDVRRPVGKGNFFGLGLHLMRDQAGVSNFTRNQGAISGSFQKKLSGGRRRGPTSYLVAGGQLAFGQRGFDVEKLWFSNQFFVDASTREAYIDQGLASGEAFAATSSGLYLDFNAGLLYYAVLDDNTSFYAGAAAFHLNEPNISSIGEMDNLNRKYVGHMGGEVPFGSSGFSILPAAQVQSQGPAFSAIAGANIRYTQREWREVGLRAGLWVHASNRLDKTSTDALIVSAIVDMDRWQFGLSYDITVTDLRESNNGRGAFEISMIYTQPANYRSQVECPRF